MSPISSQTKSIGKKTWALADGYIPAWGTGPEPEFLSHEAFCILNVNDEDADVRVTVYYDDREPVGPYTVKVPARRTGHFRFNDFLSPEPIPKGRSYSALFESDVPVVIQHTRLDSRQACNALMTTIAFPGSM